MHKLSIPDYLSLLRLVLSFIVFIFIIFFKIFNHPTILFIANIIFIIVAITDYFDGYFAKKYGQSSPYGRFLDYISDKFLVNLTFLALIYVDKIYLFIPVLFLLRDYYTLILRNFFKEYYTSFQTQDLKFFGFNLKFFQGIKYGALACIMYSYEKLFFLPGWLVIGIGYMLALLALAGTLYLTYQESDLIFKKAFKSDH